MCSREDPVKEIPRYLIGYVSRRIGCHPNTVKAYEEQGYVKPVRDSNGFRRYTKSQMERLKKIYEIKNPS